MFDFSEVKNYDPELAEAMENELTNMQRDIQENVTMVDASM